MSMLGSRHDRSHRRDAQRRHDRHGLPAGRGIPVRRQLQRGQREVRFHRYRVLQHHRPERGVVARVAVSSTCRPGQEPLVHLRTMRACAGLTETGYATTKMVGDAAGRLARPRASQVRSSDAPGQSVDSRTALSAGGACVGLRSTAPAVVCTPLAWHAEAASTRPHVTQLTREPAASGHRHVEGPRTHRRTRGRRRSRSHAGGRRGPSVPAVVTLVRPAARRRAHRRRGRRNNRRPRRAGGLPARIRDRA
jgi:hypothetical protein